MRAAGWGRGLGGVIQMGLWHAHKLAGGGVEINGFWTLIGQDRRVNGPGRRFVEAGIPRVRALN